MRLNSNCPNRLLDRLEKSINYLAERVDVEVEYQVLIDTLNNFQVSLNPASKLQIAIVSPGANLATSLQQRLEANLSLNSLYTFRVINPVKNAVDVVNNSELIFLIYNDNQLISACHERIISLAQKQHKSIIILVKKHQSPATANHTHISQWLNSQSHSCQDNIVVLLDNFIELDKPQHLQKIQQFLLEREPQIRVADLETESEKIGREIISFFQTLKTENWRRTKQIKDELLEGKNAPQYLQHIRQKFNLATQELRQHITPIRQAINRSRSYYLNPFMPDSWMFELQQLTESCEHKLSTESNNQAYLYLVVGKEHPEYIHSYVLGLYQQKIDEALESQWSKINYEYGDRGLSAIVDSINTELAEIKLLQSLPTELAKIEFDSQTIPSFQLTEIVNLQCLKLNSRVIFDYKFTQSSWFRLSLLLVIGILIYVVSKLFFQNGIIIGFIILVFQLINILTGQNIKTLKLKQHQKELQRQVYNKYQTLIRLIVEQLIQTLIINLDRQEKEYLEQIKAIASLAESEIDAISEELEQYKAKGDHLKQDEKQILSWFNQG